MKLYPISEIVCDILENWECARDDDKLLIFLVWQRELDSDKLYTLTSSLMDRLTNPNTISRAKRNLQKKYPKFRGVKYYKYHFSKCRKYSCQKNILSGILHLAEL